MDSVPTVIVVIVVMFGMMIVLPLLLMLSVFLVGWLDVDIPTVSSVRKAGRCE